MTKYYCRANVCKINHKGRHLCCWNCISFQWCEDMGEWKGCQPWTCGKSIRVSDYYRRYYNRLGYMELTGSGPFPVRKCLKKKLIANHRNLLKGIC